MSSRRTKRQRSEQPRGPGSTTRCNTRMQLADTAGDVYRRGHGKIGDARDARAHLPVEDYSRQLRDLRCSGYGASLTGHSHKAGRRVVNNRASDEIPRLVRAVCGDHVPSSIIPMSSISPRSPFNFLNRHYLCNMVCFRYFNWIRSILIGASLLVA